VIGFYWLAFALIVLGGSFFALASMDASREGDSTAAVVYSAAAAFVYLAATFLALSVP